MLAPVRTVAPVDPVISLDEAKALLRVTGSADDAIITTLIAAATGHLDGWSGILGRALVSQTWRQDFCGFKDKMRLPLAPAASIVGVTYQDVADNQQALSSSAYSLYSDAIGPYLARKSSYAWPSTYDRVDSVSVTYVAGTAAVDLPPPIKLAITLMVARTYQFARSDLMLKREVVQGVGEFEYGGGVDVTKAIDNSIMEMIAPYRRVLA